MTKGPTKQMWKRILCIVIVLALMGFGTITARLFQLMVVDAEFYQQKALEQQLRDVEVPAKRGTIYDSNMNVLASSASAWTVYVTPTDIKDDAERSLIADGLSEILDMDREKILEITKKKTGYEKVKEKLEKPDADQVRQFVSENNLGSIVGLDETTKRYYPNDNLASTVLGFVGTDNQGLAGLEAYYDETLTGTPGRVVAAKNARGADMPFSYEKMIDAKTGNSLVLTIDQYIQYVVEKHLSKAIEDNNVTSRGCCIVMDVNTGGVLAMATLPDFNPNEPFVIYNQEAAAEIEKLTDKEEKAKARSEAQNQQWRNKAVSDTYEPGSVYKIVTGSAAIEEGTVTPSSTFECPGYIQIANRRISCAKHEGHGHQTLAQAFMNSCNPAFITIGQKLGLDSFTAFREAFGVTSRTGIDLPGESDPIYHAKKDMGVVELASESFGQTFKVTPIQMITAVAAAVNGGNYYQPHLVKQVLDENQNIVKTTDVTPKRQVISQQTSEMLRGFLEGVVKEGSGKNAYIPGYRIGGKTGTSQKLDSEDESARISSFCGIAPANAPQIAVLMFLDEPHGPIIYGGTIVAPVVGDILEEILPYLGVQPQYTEEEKEALDVATPDVIGKKTDAAKSAVTSQNLECKVVGEGDTVMQQVPGAGQPIPKGGTVVLYTGKVTQNTKVPNFMGMTPSQANAAAANAGVNIRLSGAVESAGATVQAQSIDKDTPVSMGTIVTIEFRENINVE